MYLNEESISKSYQFSWTESVNSVETTNQNPTGFPPNILVWKNSGKEKLKKTSSVHPFTHHLDASANILPYLPYHKLPVYHSSVHTSTHLFNAYLSCRHHYISPQVLPILSINYSWYICTGFSVGKIYITIKCTNLKWTFPKVWDTTPVYNTNWYQVWNINISPKLLPCTCQPIPRTHTSRLLTFSTMGQFCPF